MQARRSWRGGGGFAHCHHDSARQKPSQRGYWSLRFNRSYTLGDHLSPPPYACNAISRWKVTCDAQFGLAVRRSPVRVHVSGLMLAAPFQCFAASWIRFAREKAFHCALARLLASFGDTAGCTPRERCRPRDLSSYIFRPVGSTRRQSLCTCSSQTTYSRGRTSTRATPAFVRTALNSIGIALPPVAWWHASEPRCGRTLSTLSVLRKGRVLAQRPEAVGRLSRRRDSPVSAACDPSGSQRRAMRKGTDRAMRGLLAFPNCPSHDTFAPPVRARQAAMQTPAVQQ